MEKRTVAFISYGQGGWLVDLLLSANGIGKLHRRVAALGVDAGAVPRKWWEYRKIADEIADLPDDVKVVIGGASLGANMAPWIAATVHPRPVDLVFGIQPSLYGTRNPVSKNVKRALCIYNPSALITGGLGAYRWELAPGNKATALVVKESNAVHPGDFVEWIQVAILDEIKKVQAQ